MRRTNIAAPTGGTSDAACGIQIRQSYARQSQVTLSILLQKIQQGENGPPWGLPAPPRILLRRFCGRGARVRSSPRF